MGNGVEATTGRKKTSVQPIRCCLGVVRVEAWGLEGSVLSVVLDILDCMQVLTLCTVLRITVKNHFPDAHWS